MRRVKQHLMLQVAHARCPGVVLSAWRLWLKWPCLQARLAPTLTSPRPNLDSCAPQNWLSTGDNMWHIPA